MLDDKYGLLDSDHVNIFEDLLIQYGNGIVMDLGCGSRNPADNKSKLVKTLIGVDGSEFVNQELAKESLPDNFSFFLEDICDMPFKDNYADLVLMLGIYTALPPKKLYEQLKDKYSSFK